MIIGGLHIALDMADMLLPRSDFQTLKKTAIYQCKYSRELVSTSAVGNNGSADCEATEIGAYIISCLRKCIRPVSGDGLPKGKIPRTK